MPGSLHFTIRWFRGEGKFVRRTCLLAPSLHRVCNGRAIACALGQAPAWTHPNPILNASSFKFRFLTIFILHHPLGRNRFGADLVRPSAAEAKYELYRSIKHCTITYRKFIFYQPYLLFNMFYFLVKLLFLSIFNTVRGMVYAPLEPEQKMQHNVLNYPPPSPDFNIGCLPIRRKCFFQSGKQCGA